MAVLSVLFLVAATMGAAIGETPLSVLGSSAMAKAMDFIGESFEGDAIYTAQSSGAGIECALDGSCDIGASDVPIPSEDWVNGTLTIPIMVGGVALAHNVKGVTGIKLRACDIARIYTGKTTTWGDESIADTQIPDGPMLRCAEAVILWHWDVLVWNKSRHLSKDCSLFLSGIIKETCLPIIPLENQIR